MKNHTKLSCLTIAMLFAASTSYTMNKFKQIASIIDQVGKRTSMSTTQILNGGDNQQTLSSLSMQLEDTQTYLYDAITAGSGTSTTYLSTQLGVTTPQVLTTSPIDAASLLNVTNGQVSNILLSEWNPAISTTVTTSNGGGIADKVAAYNTALTDALTVIGTDANSGVTIVAIRNFTYPPQANYASLQTAITETENGIAALNDALIAFSAMALDNPTITSPYGLSTIYNSLGQLATSLAYMLDLLESQVQYYPQEPA
ncbi:MAG: hypothetical protein ACXWL5_03360 [Candidatus Chromulinivorax sp.]